MTSHKIYLYRPRLKAFAGNDQRSSWKHLFWARPPGSERQKPRQKSQDSCVFRVERHNYSGQFAFLHHGCRFSGRYPLALSLLLFWPDAGKRCHIERKYGHNTGQAGVAGKHFEIAEYPKADRASFAFYTSFFPGFCACSFSRRRAILWPTFWNDPAPRSF